MRMPIICTPAGRRWPVTTSRHALPAIWKDGLPPAGAQTAQQSAQTILAGVARNERLVLGDQGDVSGAKNCFNPATFPISGGPALLSAMRRCWPKSFSIRQPGGGRAKFIGKPGFEQNAGYSPITQALCRCAGSRSRIKAYRDCLMTQGSGQRRLTDPINEPVFAAPISSAPQTTAPRFPLRDRRSIDQESGVRCRMRR